MTYCLVLFANSHQLSRNSLYRIQTVTAFLQYWTESCTQESIEWGESISYWLVVWCFAWFGVFVLFVWGLFCCLVHWVCLYVKNNIHYTWLYLWIFHPHGIICPEVIYFAAGCVHARYWELSLWCRKHHRNGAKLHPAEINNSIMVDLVGF